MEPKAAKLRGRDMIAVGNICLSTFDVERMRAKKYHWLQTQPMLRTRSWHSCAIWLKETGTLTVHQLKAGEVEIPRPTHFQEFRDKAAFNTPRSFSKVEA